MTVKIGVHGAGGRMGRAVVQLVHDADDIALGCAIEGPASTWLGRDAGELAGVSALDVAVSADLSQLARADVVIDFSLPVALEPLLDACEKQRKPLVLATTGLSPAQWKRIDELSEVLPIVAAPNYSTGVAVLYHLARQASALLAEFDLEIVEMHHRHKVDAPSGTALGLAEAAASGRALVARDVSVYGRHGHTGARSADEIGVMTLRGGDVVGDHTLMLAGEGERLELTHRASNRTLFARGALRAARFVVGRPAGRYGMNDVLGLV
jgi:4-hydroxy-tetrahydrodipicolinate reductase